MLLTKLGRIPCVSETCDVDGLFFRVEDASDRAVITVHLTVRATS